jgi:hypothetical protein
MDRPQRAELAIWSYGDGLGRTVDALTLLRNMTGDHIDHEVDRTMRSTLVSLLGNDDLSWCPAEPWTMPIAHTRPAWLQQGTLLALASLYQFSGEERYHQLAARLIDAIDRLGQRDAAGHFSFPGQYFTHRDGWAEAPAGPMEKPAVYGTTVNMPLMVYHLVTGQERALKLASDLIDYGLREMDGGKRLFTFGHFHSDSRLLTALILRGIVMGEKQDLQLAQELYGRALRYGTRSGWFPETIRPADSTHFFLSETCCLTDMLEAAILLAMRVDGRYWNDVERWARNHLLVHQITATQWMRELRPGANRRPLGEGQIESEEVAQRLVGGFAGWGGVNEMSDDSQFSIINQHCCNAAGARGLYDVWRYGVGDDGERFSVHLHLHRAHASADVIVVESGGAAELIVRMRRGRAVMVRVPESLSAQEMRGQVNGRTASMTTPKAGYISLGRLGAGDEARISYPLKESRTTERIGAIEYTFHWRGATVRGVEPPGRHGALFVDERFVQETPDLGAAVAREINSLGIEPVA